MLETTLQKLADPKQSLAHKLLRDLSNLDRTGLATVQRSWAAMPEARRLQIVVALVEMAEDDAEMDFVDIYRFLLTDGDAAVRATAISGLWETTDVSFMDPLIQILRSDPSPQVREAAAEVLGHFGMLAAEERLQAARSKRLLDALLDTFRSSDPANTPEVRRNVLESAAFFSDDERVVAAVRDAYKDPNLTVRSGAISAMGISFDQGWEDIVTKELESVEAEMRFVAARAAGELWLENAVPRLSAMTKDPDHEVRLEAIWSLGEIGGLQAKATLTQLLESHDESLRDAAEEALDELRFNENPIDFGDVFGGKKKKGKDAGKG